MEIKQLIYFTETARLQHMTEASAVLNVAQSALSRQIGLLENDLEIKLFKREGRNIVLTEAGKEFYEDAVKILEIVDRTRDKITENKISSAQSFNIHMTKSDMTSKILYAFQNLLRQNTGIDFNIETGDEGLVQDKLMDNSLDIAVSTKKFTDENLRSTLLFDQNYYYIFRESSEVNLPVKATLNELEEMPIVTLNPVMDIEEQFKSASILNVDDTTIIQHLLIHNGYIAILSYEETKILKHNYPNFVVHSLSHLNIKQPLYVSMKEGNAKPFVHEWYNQLRNEFSSVGNNMMN